MNIRVLVENELAANSMELKAEHGLSLYIEANGKKILFDAGSSDIFIENADKMGIPFKKTLGESKPFIAELGRTMQKFDIENIYTCHCTGLKAYKLRKETMQDKLEYLKTDQQINLEE